MKPKSIFLGLSIVLSLLIATLLPASPTLATPAPDPEAGRSRIENQKSEIDSLWSSGWVDLSPGESRTLLHNMGGDIEDYALQMWFRDTDAGGYGVNNRGYGSLEDNGVWLGAFWRSLTDTTIAVARQPADTMAEQVRVWIWPSQYSSPPYCTDWSAIGQGATVTVVHSLGGNPDDYVVKLWFRSTSPTGVHQVYYGGVEGGGKLYGAYWHGLDDTQIQVSRHYADIEAQEFLLCVGLTDPPDYDSGWGDIVAGQTSTLFHYLGGSINRYIVRMEFKQVAKEGMPEAPMKIHHYAYGGDASNVVGKDAKYVGANWQNLTNQSIDVYRWADDPYANQVRVRIWLRRLSVYLPVVLRNHP